MGNDGKITLKVKQAGCLTPILLFLFPGSKVSHPERITLWAEILLILKTFTIHELILSSHFMNGKFKRSVIKTSASKEAKLLHFLSL